MSGIKGINKGEKNGQWKGDQVGYQGIHVWVKNHKPKPRSCQKCHTLFVALDLANKSGEYKRDISDWDWLCRRCHMESDGRLKNLIKRNHETNMKGEAHPCSKLTEQDVLYIRASNETGVKLAAMFGVQPPAISKIRKRLTWGGKDIMDDLIDRAELMRDSMEDR